MKRLMLITSLVIAAPFAYAETEMARDAAASVHASAETAASTAAAAVEVIDKGTQAVPEQQELSQAKTAEPAQ
jgi:archaellum component FlaG (FlaF/FlaG flagellin family)